jgi:hypothetical protein
MASNSKLRTLNSLRDSLLIKMTRRKLRSPEGSLGTEIYMMISSKTTMTPTPQIKSKKKTMLTLTPSILSMTYSWPIRNVMTWRPVGRRGKWNVRSC